MFSQRAKTSDFKQRQKLKLSLSSDVCIYSAFKTECAQLYITSELYRTQKFKIQALTLMAYFKTFFKKFSKIFSKF